METKTIYRIENPVEMHGMWYDKQGNFDPIIEKLCPEGLAKDFPMPFNFRHKKSKKHWYSAGKSIDNMNQWFSPQDAINLMNNGFKLFQFDVTEFQELEMECLFTREGIIAQEEIPLEVVWDININRN